LVVWSTEGGVIAMANRQAADLAGIPLEQLIGSTIYDFARVPRAARAETEALATGGGGFFGTRPLQDASHRELSAYMWTRAVRVGEAVAAVALVIPESQTAWLGRDPSRQLRRLYPVAVGAMNSEWRIEAVSVDIRELTGLHSDAIVGHRLVEFVHEGDVAKLTDAQGRPPQSPRSQCSIRLAHLVRGWVETCWLLAPFDTDRWAFALLSHAAATGTPDDRVAELELRLRRIGAEVTAAGVIDSLIAVPTPIDVSKLHELTTRQWEILTLLLQGKRVPTIARELYVSQSTVRNHLSAIFRKLQVHSQPELLEALRLQTETSAART
jgi:DNA-binding CsgD family transcriptional regulator/PAS domain-containing protein